MNLLEMTTDINGKPIPRWQERLEWMYTEHVLFGEILSLVRALIDDSAIEAILTMPDDQAAASITPERAVEVRQQFNTIARLVRERDELKKRLEQIQAIAEKALLP